MPASWAGLRSRRVPAAIPTGKDRGFRVGRHPGRRYRISNRGAIDTNRIRTPQVTGNQAVAEQRVQPVSLKSGAFGSPYHPGTNFPPPGASPRQGPGNPVDSQRVAESPPRRAFTSTLRPRPPKAPKPAPSAPDSPPTLLGTRVTERVFSFSGPNATHLQTARTCAVGRGGCASAARGKRCSDATPTGRVSAAWPAPGGKRSRGPLIPPALQCATERSKPERSDSPAVVRPAGRFNPQSARPGDRPGGPLAGARGPHLQHRHRPQPLGARNAEMGLQLYTSV